MADNYDFITCPACGEIMKKIYLEEQGFMVDICLDGCGGIWLDNRELKKIDEKHEDITPIKESYAGKNFKEVDKTQVRKCPICNTPMVKNTLGTAKDVEIDECYSCGGKFFDYQELEAMRIQYENDKERSKDVLSMFINDLMNEEGFNNISKKDIRDVLNGNKK